MTMDKEVNGKWANTDGIVIEVEKLVKHSLL